MEVFLHPNILKTDYNKYLFKREFRLRLQVSKNFDSGSATLHNNTIFAVKIKICTWSYTLYNNNPLPWSVDLKEIIKPVCCRAGHRPRGSLPQPPACQNLGLRHIMASHSYLVPVLQIFVNFLPKQLCDGHGSRKKRSPVPQPHKTVLQ